MVAFRKEFIPVLIVLAAAVLSRAVALWMFSDNLSLDRDAYRAIAENLAEGNGYRAAAASEPTAYRPPLYPLLLALLLKLGGGSPGLGILQLLAGTGTVYLTWKVGRLLGLNHTAWIAALLVAVDPLSVHNTTSIMTETVFTFLVMLLLYSVLRQGWPGLDRREAPVLSFPGFHKAPTPATQVNQAVIGLLFGLCALCRPTIWAFGALAGVIWFLNALRSGTGLRKQVPWVMLLSVSVVVSGWVIRNAIVIGRPILTTTHGGYTLLLGNNPVFYEEVVNRPWGTTWEAAPAERSQQAWIADVQSSMHAELGTNATELERDRWMYRRAFRNIAGEPGLFLRACWLRVRRLWNVVPHSPVKDSLPDPVVWLIALFYSATGLGMLVGIFCLERTEWRRWLPLVLLILSFTALHCLYWSNMRMRAPLIPAIALLATRGLFGKLPVATESPAAAETGSTHKA